MYAALMGAGLLLGVLGAHLLDAGARRGTRTRIISAFAVVAVIVGFGALSAQRNAVLADPLELWKHTVAQSPDKVRPNLGMAYQLFAEKRYDEGHRYLERAAAIDPDHHEVNYNFGVYHEHTGHLRLARDHFRRAFEARPLVGYAKSMARAEKKLGEAHRP